MSQDPINDDNIINQATEILLKLKTGNLYGKKIDLDNIPQVLVAAYYLGWAERSNQDERRLSHG